MDRVQIENWIARFHALTVDGYLLEIEKAMEETKGTHIHPHLFRLRTAIEARKDLFERLVTSYICETPYRDVEEALNEYRQHRICH